MSDYEEVWSTESFEDIIPMDNNYQERYIYSDYDEEYREAYRMASEFLEGEIWRKYWRYPLFLLDQLRCEICPYAKNDKKFFEDWKNIIKTETLGEGYCARRDGVTYILYQQDNPCPERKTYVFHHEGGHVIGVHSILYKDILLSNDKQKDKLEDEATIIGRNVFLPAYIIKHLLKSFDYEIVKKYYNKVYHVSKQYFDVRFKHLEKDLRNMIYPECIKEEAEKELNDLENWYFLETLVSF